jgi:pyruvate kinase
MIAHLRAAERELGRTCRVLCDLAGPKLRTCELEPGPAVVKWQPRRSELGHVEQKAQLWLRPGPAPDEGDDCVLPVDAALLTQARVGDELVLADTRGRERRLALCALEEDGALAECEYTGYATEGLPLELRRGELVVARGVVGVIPARARALVLAVGDRLSVTRKDVLGRPAREDASGQVLEPARIGCSFDAAFGAVRVGERVLFDDGKFESVVRSVEPDAFEVELVRAGVGTAKLRAEKGINFPDTTLELPALTDADRSALDFVAVHADLVALSFVHRPEDLDELEAELDRRGGRRLGKVLKIETRSAFEQLPTLLLAGIRRPPIAVMVARGDLGVELGFERLAEVQEEMLWLCEAAHVPVIWATQVLETLAKQGLPSRGEVTDAAMAARAECVMLNKGPHIRAAVSFLDTVLERMQHHQSKKSAMLRRLSVSES